MKQSWRPSVACLREIQIRAGMTAILVATFTLFMGLDLRLWLAPPAVAALVWLKWRLASPEGAQAPDPDADDSP